MTVKLITLKPKQDVIADIEEIRTKDEQPKIVGYQTYTSIFNFID